MKRWRIYNKVHGVTNRKITSTRHNRRRENTKSNVILNNEELRKYSEQSAPVPLYMKGNKTDYNNCIDTRPCRSSSG
jgi:hypothetical protein